MVINQHNGRTTENQEQHNQLTMLRGCGWREGGPCHRLHGNRVDVPYVYKTLLSWKYRRQPEEVG